MEWFFFLGGFFAPASYLSSWVAFLSLLDLSNNAYAALTSVALSVMVLYFSLLFPRELEIQYESKLKHFLTALALHVVLPISLYLDMRQFEFRRAFAYSSLVGFLFVSKEVIISLYNFRPTYRSFNPKKDTFLPIICGAFILNLVIVSILHSKYKVPARRLNC